MLDDEEIAKQKYKGELTIIVCELLRDMTFVIGVIVFVGLILI